MKLKDPFEELIVDYFIREYSNARTPNPCVICNDELKFGALMEVAFEDGMEAFASGHYARIYSHPLYGEMLAKGSSVYKDQAYFLSRIKKEKLPFLLFPNGEFTKEEIRREAREQGLRVHDKRDSQELCFVPDNNYRRFLGERGVKFKPGDIVDLSGKVIGTHEGLPLYTVGQRHGLRVSTPERYYVIGMEVETNRLVVGPFFATQRNTFAARDLNWFIPGPQDEFSCTCKVRSNMKEVGARVIKNADVVNVSLEKNIHAITPGQLDVFNKGEPVIGSGFIDSFD